MQNLYLFRFFKKKKIQFFLLFQGDKGDAGTSGVDGDLGEKGEKVSKDLAFHHS